MTTLEITEEEYRTDDLFPDEEDLLKETWPIVPDETVREFEQYLLDIGVRI